MVIEERANAKINMLLHITGKDSSGKFHNIESIMCPVDLHDVVRYAPSPEPFSIVMRGLSPADEIQLEDNTVYKAVRWMEQVFSQTATGTFEIEKKLPLFSGMGGSSTDAAAAMRIFQKIWNVRVTAQHYRSICENVGCDVVFFLENKPSFVRGVGEIVEPILEFQPWYFVVARPNVNLEAADMYKRYAQLRMSAGRDYDQSLTRDTACILTGHNALQTPACDKSNLVSGLLSTMSTLAAPCAKHIVRMSGSGATCFAAFQEKSDRDAMLVAMQAYKRENSPDWPLLAAADALHVQQSPGG